ncbi:Leucine rich repeat domain containing protein [Tolypocladium paradoxum]|uniref:Leucine rich repeat domain containing protein n=1 Tax=Tolypocladium paradoxum TaxID=94208 RepID=A0A2S4KWM2_9HYPO|nr:Leucine rich repeat domain containing protein [Tolypocladium paradoxum]
MDSLPSYQEATTRPDWLGLVAPYVQFADYRSLCLVSRRSWLLFAPRLWADLFAAVRLSGLDPGDDLTWWFDFVFNQLGRVAPSTRALVRILDARNFARDAYHFASCHDHRSLGQSFKRALELLPNVDSILLDGHADLDPGFLIGSLLSSPEHRPRMLSIADCPFHLPNTLFSSPCLQKLVYLDASGVPGSIMPLLLPTLLPDLRILKVRRREIDDSTLNTLVGRFLHRLWSLDLSDNKITDAAIQKLRDCCISPALLRSDAHFRVEGKVAPLSHGTPQHGQFFTIEESEWSGTFAHPERHFADTPAYMANAGPQEFHAFRSNGTCPIRKDLAESAARVLSKHDTDPEVDAFRTSRGITHLRLSNTKVSSFGIQKLLRISSGHVEDFACDSMHLLPASSPGSKFWPQSANLYGILGAAHLFRPVFSSNLRVLRIHHSLVTHVPTLHVDGLSTMARVFLAETSILQRVDKAYPQAFVPDMNPRLASLTLTRLPRRSSGPLVAKLIQFIKLLSIQERAIQDAAAGASSSWRGPSLLQGLRHLALEFEPDPMENGFSTSEDVDAEELMNSGEQVFSFFDDERIEKRQPATAASRLHTIKASHSSAVADDAHPSGSDRDKEYVTYDGEWNGEFFSLPVWTGAAPGSNEVLDEYRRLAVNDGLRDGAGPATPSQIAAGAPDKSYVFHTAWCAAVMPRELNAPARADLAGMRDVLDVLRAYRLAGRAKYSELQTRAGDWGLPVPLGEPHFFWTGTLKVSTSKKLPDAHPLQYWR